VRRSEFTSRKFLSFQANHTFLDIDVDVTTLMISDVVTGIMMVVAVFYC